MAPRNRTADTSDTMRVVVVFDAFNWTDRDEFGNRNYNSVPRGETITVPTSVAERGIDLGALIPAPDTEDPDAIAAAVAANRGPSAASMTDEQLRGMTVEELIAHVNQYPADLARVIELEQTRDASRDEEGRTVAGGPRPEILGLTDAVTAQQHALAQAQDAADRQAALAAAAAGGDTSPPPPGQGGDVPPGGPPPA